MENWNRTFDDPGLIEDIKESQSLEQFVEESIRVTNGGGSGGVIIICGLDKLEEERVPICRILI